MMKKLFLILLVTGLAQAGIGPFPGGSGGGGSGITSINADTTAAQVITSGTSGTDIGVATSSGTTTISIPSASTTARGVITTTSQTVTGDKIFGGAVSVTDSLNILGNAFVGTGSAVYALQSCETNSGNSGTAKTLNLATCPSQKSTLTGSVTYTLSNPVVGGAYVIRIVQGSGSYTATWPGNVLWSGGTAPTITVTAGKIDLINLYYDGTSYYGSFTQNY